MTSVQVPWIPECPSVARVSRCLKCSSAQVSWVSKCSSSAQMPKYLTSTLGVTLTCPLSTQFPFEYSSIKKKVSNITRKGLVNSFIEILKTFFSEYIFYIALIVSFFLGNKMCKFYHVLIARRNHSQGFQKLSLNIFQSFKKLNRMEFGALFLVKLQYYSCSVQFYYYSCRITESSLVF